MPACHVALVIFHLFSYFSSVFFHEQHGKATYTHIYMYAYTQNMHYFMHSVAHMISIVMENYQCLRLPCLQQWSVHHTALTWSDFTLPAFHHFISSNKCQPPPIWPSPDPVMHSGFESVRSRRLDTTRAYQPRRDASVKFQPSLRKKTSEHNRAFFSSKACQTHLWCRQTFRADVSQHRVQKSGKLLS